MVIRYQDDNVNLIWLPKNRIAESAQPKNCPIVSPDLPLAEGGVWGQDYIICPCVIKFQSYPDQSATQLHVA